MRVAITGMGIWSSLGRNRAEFEEHLRAGDSGVCPVTRMDVSHPFFRSRSAAVLSHESALRPELDQTMIEDIRGRGLLIGLEVKVGYDDAKLQQAFLDEGILTKETRHRTFRFATPLTVDAALVDEVVARVGRALKAAA